jgi:hypothetical protein
MNPSVPQSFIDAETEKDPANGIGYIRGDRMAPNG